MVVLDQHKWRIRQVNEKARYAERSDEGETEKMAITQQKRVGGQDAPNAGVHSRGAWPRLRYRAQNEASHDRCREDDPEHGSPAAKLDHEASCERSKN